MVPPRGFEPLISTLKGWRPRPLDDGGTRNGRSLPEAPFATTADEPEARPASDQAAGRDRRKPMIAPAMHTAPMIAAIPPPIATPKARPVRPSTPAFQVARSA